MLAVVPGSAGVSSTRAKIMRPALVVSELVTTMAMVLPTCAAPPSTTIIVPSIRCPMPCEGFSPRRVSSISSRSPEIACPRSDPARRLMLMVVTPAISPTLAMPRSVVTTRYPRNLATSINPRSTLVASMVASSMVMSNRALDCILAIMSSPRRPRARFPLSELSESFCSSSITACSTMNGASRAPDSDRSRMRPSMIALESSSIGRTPRFCLLNST